MRLSLITAALAIALTACGGGSNSSPVPAPAPPSIALSSTSSLALSGGKPVPLSAAVSSSDAVTWQLAAGAPGSLSTTSGSTVNYVPPAAVAAITRVNIEARAGGASKTISLTLYPDPGAPGLSHIAGSLGGPGYLDGAGTAARFSSLADTATDHAGNLYVLEGGANTIRKITPAGVVTTVLQGAPGHADGASGQARLGAIRAIAAGGNGAILFIDSAGDLTYLRQLAADGSVTTLLQHRLLDDARALAAGPGNTAYVMRTRSIVVAGAGNASVLAGEESDSSSPAADGQGAAARFSGLAAMTPDRDGGLLVAQHGRLSKVTPAGVVSTVRSLPADDITLSLTLDDSGMPLVLARTADSGTARNYAVRQLRPSGATETLFAGSYLDVPFDQEQTIPLQLRMANGKVLLTRSTDIRQLQGSAWQPFAGLAHESFADTDGPGNTARFANPELLAADDAGNLYVSDYPDSFKKVSFLGRAGGLYLRKITPDHTVRTLLIRQAFGVPNSMVTDHAGNLYVSEIPPVAGHQAPLGGAVYKVTPDGALSLLAGQPAAAGGSQQQVDGAGGSARFIRPKLVGADTAGNVYVNDTFSDTASFRKIAPDGMVTTVTALPAGVGAAPDGHSYTVEAGAVYRTSAGGKEVIAGVPGRYGNLPGALPGGLAAPAGLAFSQTIAPTGPYSFAVISGSAILKLVLPH